MVGFAPSCTEIAHAGSPGGRKQTYQLWKDAFPQFPGLRCALRAPSSRPTSRVWQADTVREGVRQLGMHKSKELKGDAFKGAEGGGGIHCEGSCLSSWRGYDDQGKFLSSRKRQALRPSSRQANKRIQEATSCSPSRHYLGRLGPPSARRSLGGTRRTR